MAYTAHSPFPLILHPPPLPPPLPFVVVVRLLASFDRPTDFGANLTLNSGPASGPTDLVRGEYRHDVLQSPTATAVNAGQYHGHAGRDAEIDCSSHTCLMVKSAAPALSLSETRFTPKLREFSYSCAFAEHQLSSFLREKLGIG